MTDLDSLAARVAARRRVVDTLAGEARAVLETKRSLDAEVETLTAETDVLDKVVILLNSLAEERQAQAQGVIETLVTQGLQTIFDDSLSFHIVPTTKARTSGVEFVVRSTLTHEAVETPVMDARGGGLAAVVGFLLRLVVMLLSAQSGREKLLVLDETFAHVSEDYLEPLGQFLRQIVDRTGVQIIMVTHQPEFLEFADVAYRFSQIDGRTKVSAHGK